MDKRVITGRIAMLAAPLRPALNLECVIPLEGDCDIAITVNVRGGYLYGPMYQVQMLPDRVKE